MNPIELMVQTVDNHGLWSTPIEIKRNTILCKPNKIHTDLYTVLNGSLRAYIIDDNNDEQNIRFAYKGSIFTALDSFLTEKPTSFYIQAIRKTKLKVVHKSKIDHLISTSPDFKELWIQILNSFVVQQMQREEDLLINSPSIRYQRVLNRSPKLFQEIPNKYIASYLRMKPETFSRIKKS